MGGDEDQLKDFCLLVQQGAETWGIDLEGTPFGTLISIIEADLGLTKADFDTLTLTHEE